MRFFFNSFNRALSKNFKSKKSEMNLLGTLLLNKQNKEKCITMLESTVLPMTMLGFCIYQGYRDSEERANTYKSYYEQATSDATDEKDPFSISALVSRYCKR
jgi:hypothetical protein